MQSTGIWTVACCCLFVVTGWIHAAEDIGANGDCAKGLVAWRAGQFEEAVGFLDNVPATDSNYPVARAIKGSSLIFLHRITEADACLDLIRKEHPDSILPMAIKANLLRDTGKGAEAVELADKMLKADARSIWDFIGRAHAQILKQNTDDAIRSFSKAIEVDPTNAIPFHFRGGTYRQQGQFRQAVVDFTEAVRLDPRFAMAYSERGAAQDAQKNYTDAIRDHNRAVEINPKFALAYMNRGSSFGYQQQFENAIRDFDRAIELDSKLAEAYVNRGAARRVRSNDADGAIADYNRAIAINDRLPIAYYNRGVAWRQKNDYARAVEDYTKAIELKPDYQEAYHSRGVAYLNSGNKTRALADWKKAYDLAPNTPVGQSAWRNYQRNQ